MEDAFPFVFVCLDLQELTYVRMGCLIKVHESKDNKEHSAGKSDFRERGSASSSCKAKIHYLKKYNILFTCLYRYLGRKVSATHNSNECTHGMTNDNAQRYPVYVLFAKNENFQFTRNFRAQNTRVDLRWQQQEQWSRFENGLPIHPKTSEQRSAQRQERTPVASN